MTRGNAFVGFNFSEEEILNLGYDVKRKLGIRNMQKVFSYSRNEEVIIAQGESPIRIIGYADLSTIEGTFYYNAFIERLEKSNGEKR